jgi:hypothetical protein
MHERTVSGEGIMEERFYRYVEGLPARDAVTFVSILGIACSLDFVFTGDLAVGAAGWAFTLLALLCWWLVI